MAILLGRNLSGLIKLSLAPVTPSLSGQDAEQYDVEICPSDDSGSVLSRRFSVKDWQTQQDDVWVFSRAFAEAAILMEIVIPIDLWRTGRGRPADLCVSAWWVSVRLFGIRPQKKIRAIILVAEDSDCTVFRQFSLACKVEDVVRFGNELEKEIVQASPHWANKRRLKTI